METKSNKMADMCQTNSITISTSCNAIGTSPGLEHLIFGTPVPEYWYHVFFSL